jgi:hypothetical protein
MRIKNLSLIAAALAVSIAFGFTTGHAATKKDPVTNQALKWLELIDAGNYAQSWQQASTLFKGAVSEGKWVKTLKGLRAPLGKVASRQQMSKQEKSKLPGAPDGNYVIFQFKTSFTKKKSAVETVTLSQEPDGKWRASGYFIK